MKGTVVNQTYHSKNEMSLEMTPTDPSNPSIIFYAYHANLPL